MAAKKQINRRKYLALEKFSKRLKSPIFILVFAVAGIAIIFAALAQSNDGSKPTDIAISYYKLKPTMVRHNLKTNQTTYDSVSESYTILADGTLVCDDGSADGVIGTGKVAPGQLKQLKAEMADINDYPNTIAPANAKGLVSNNEGFLLENEDSLKSVVVAKGANKPSKLAKIQAKLVNTCQDGAKSKAYRGQLKDITRPKGKISDGGAGQQSWIAGLLMPKAYANSTPTATSPPPFVQPTVANWADYSKYGYIEPLTNIADDQAAQHQALRARLGIYQQKRMTCLDIAAIVQAESMALIGGIYHNPKLGKTIADACGSEGMRYYEADPAKQSSLNTWKMLGENVGYVTYNALDPKNSSNILFGLYLASPGHYDNMVNKIGKCYGHAAFRNKNDNRVYHVMVNAAWAGPCQ